MNAIHQLVKDLQAADVPYEPDLTFPCPVRHRTCLHIALGTLCERHEERGQLARRVLSALRWLDGVGLRSRFAGWFRP